MNVEQRILNYIGQHDLLPMGSHVLVGVSGGPDSMALLDILRRWQKNLGLRAIGAVCVDHGLRPESKAELSMVRNWCAQNGIAFLGYRAPDGWQQEDSHASLEEAARRLRYGFFEEALKTTGADRFALAHHGDDRAETVLMDMLCGCGRSGLSGIPPKRLPYVRPLLMVTKQELLAYCRAKGIPYAEDSTNQDLAFRRNRIRHELLPDLAAAYNPCITQALNRTAEILYQEENYLQQQVDRAKNDLVIEEGKNTILLRRKASDLHVALLRRLLLDLGEKAAAKPLSLDRVEALCKAVGGPSGRRIELGGGAFAQLEFDRMVFYPKTKENAFLPLKLSVPMEVSQGPVTFLAAFAENIPQKPQIKENVFLTYVDRGIINSIVSLRVWQSGDTMVLKAGAPDQKLHDLFQKHRVPKGRRDQLLVLAAGSQVLWVPQLSWHAAGVKATAGAAVRLMIRMKTEE